MRDIKVDRSGKRYRADICYSYLVKERESLLCSLPKAFSTI